MGIEIIKNSLFVPSRSSNPHPLLNSYVHLTIFDRVSLNLHIPILYVFKTPVPSNEALKEGLSKALNIFPHLAGRLTVDERGHPSYILNNAGVRLVETRIDSALAEHLPLDPLSQDLTKFYQPIEDVEELLQLQINRFACGGVVIGLSTHHRVADGKSIGHFLQAWTRLVRGLDVDPLPYHDRAAISIPRIPPRSDFDHVAQEFTEHMGVTSEPIVNLCVHFSPSFITKLKAHVKGTNSLQQYSTFECVLTHIWKKITMARRLQVDDQPTKVIVGVNGRGRMKPAVPAEFFGNLVLWASPCLSVKDLLQSSYGFTAEVIHDGIGKIDDAYFQSFIDFGALLETGEKGEEGMVSTVPEGANLVCPDFEVDCWLKIQLDDIDFGSGRPCAFLPALLPVEGTSVILPSCEEKGGVDVYIALLQDQADHFKQISHSLD